MGLPWSEGPMAFHDLAVAAAVMDIGYFNGLGQWQLTNRHRE